MSVFFNSFIRAIRCTQFAYPRNSLYSIRLSAQFAVLNLENEQNKLTCLILKILKMISLRSLLRF